MPRGHFEKLQETLNSHNCDYVHDYPQNATALDLVEYEFQGELKPYQFQAANSILKRPFGVLQLPTGSGKTVTALYCVACRNQPTLVIVHTKALLYQWQTEIEKFLGIPKAKIGLIGDGKFRVGDSVTVAMIQSLGKKLNEVKDKIGFLIVDECHHTPAKTFHGAVSHFSSINMLGLSATPHRSDGLDELIHFYLGELVYKESTEECMNRGTILRPIIRTIKTNFDCDYKGDYSALIRSLTEDEQRLDLIAQAIMFFTIDGGNPLVVSDRKEHCERLEKELTKENFKVGLLTGDVKSKERESRIKYFESGEIHVLVATCQVIGEGFDCKKLDGLFLATPIKDPQKLKQLVGRIIRSDIGKRTPKIFDFVDKVWKCQSLYQKRCEVYREEGYSFETPPEEIR
jgi:superfamily II DNA or RNA helicase